MPNIHCQVILPYKSGLPQDVAVNNFTFGSGATDPSDMADEAYTRLSRFYATTPTGGTANLLTYLSTYILRAQARLKVFNLADPQPRSPIMDEVFTGWGAEPSATGSLPMETALVLSFQGNRLSGVPQARRRGRIYLGPFRLTATGGTSVTDLPGPTPALVNNLAAAAVDLSTSNDGTMNWVVHSKTYGTFTEVVNGWVDNAWDNQRRRGNDATARSVWQAL